MTIKLTLQCFVSDKRVAQMGQHWHEYGRYACQPEPSTGEGSVRLSVAIQWTSLRWILLLLLLAAIVQDRPCLNILILNIFTNVYLNTFCVPERRLPIYNHSSIISSFFEFLYIFLSVLLYLMKKYIFFAFIMKNCNVLNYS